MFGRLTLDGILSGFQRTVNKLKQFEQQAAARITKHHEQIQFHTDQKQVHQADLAKASSVRQNIEKLVGQ